MTMIALGGVIGAGLFVGSGVVIKSAGPAAVLSFVITGLLVVLVMRMLGEMAVALPAVGSFYEYARLAFADRPRAGELAGFLSGWMYWYFLGHRRRARGGCRCGLGALLDTGRTGLADQFRVARLADPDESHFGEILRRVRVLVRLDQGGGHRRFPGARGVIRSWALAGRICEHRQPDRARRLRAARGRSDPDGCGGGHGILFWSRNRHDRRGGGGRAGESGRPSHTVGDFACAVFLCGLDPSGRVSGAVEFAAHQRALCQRTRCDGCSAPPPRS